MILLLFIFGTTNECQQDKNNFVVLDDMKIDKNF